MAMRTDVGIWIRRWSEVKITKVGSTFEIFYKTLEFIVRVDFVASNEFPHLNIRVALPPSFRNEEIRGLLGSAPDDNVENDWMLRNGSIVSVPNTEAALRGADAYNYCTTNWCMRMLRSRCFIIVKRQALILQLQRLQ